MHDWGIPTMLCASFQELLAKKESSLTKLGKLFACQL